MKLEIQMMKKTEKVGNETLELSNNVRLRKYDV